MKTPLFKSVTTAIFRLVAGVFFAFALAGAFVVVALGVLVVAFPAAVALIVLPRPKAQAAANVARIAPPPVPSNETRAAD